MDISSDFLNNSSAPLANGRARYNYENDQYPNQQFELQENIGFVPDNPHQMEMDMRGDSLGSSHHDYDEPGTIRKWATQNQRETAELIKDLPSHRLEEIASSASHNANLKDRSRKSRRQKYATLSRIPKDADSEDIMRALSNELDESDSGVDPDLRLNSVLRGTTAATLSHKRQLRRKMTTNRKVRHVSWWKRQKYAMSLWWQHFKQNLAEVGYYLKLWKGHMKKIEGHFGTGVLSYFRFLKWLFLLNVPIFILTLAFVVTPQVIYRYKNQVPPGYVNNTNILPTDILTGGGWFQKTEMYYGYYTHNNITLIEGHYYSMQYAYLFTCGGYYLLCLLILAYSMSKSYRENYIEGSGEFGLYMATKVFGGWPCGITSVDAAHLKHLSLYNEFQEYLAGFKQSETPKFSDRCKWFWLRIISNLVVLGLIGGAGYLVYYLSITQQLETDILFLREMALPLCISAMLLIMPFAFSVIGGLEKYGLPKTELYISMLRTMLLKGVILGVLIYYWFNKLPCPSQTGNGTQLALTELEIEEGNSRCERCWETLMGEQIYRLVLVDFVFVLLFTFFLEYVRRWMSQCCFSRVTRPEFNIGRNTLNLIYSQTLCWLGTFYSPLLSLITIIKLFIMFYVKRFSVMQNCTASVKPWRASKTHTIFLAFLFSFFLLATVAVACSIIFIQPSPACGPYRGKTKAYDVIVDLIEAWETKERILADIIDFVTSPGFIAVIIVLLCVGTYFMHIIMTGHKEMVALLKNQLVLEGKDKTYLLDMLQEINRRNKSQGSTLTSRLSRKDNQGKHQFIKKKMKDWENQHGEDTIANRRCKGHRLF